MSTGEAAYLTMALAAVSVFFLVVLAVSIWSKGGARK